MHVSKKIASVLAVASLATAPVMAQAADRASAPVSEGSQLEDGDSTHLLIILGVVAAIIAGTTIFDNDDDPISA